MKKIFNIILILILIILITIGILFGFKILKDKHNNNPNENKEEQNIFKKYSNYNENYIDDYNIFYEQNNVLEIEEIINFINFCKLNNIDYIKNNNLIKLYNLDNFKTEYINEYLDFLIKNPNIDLNSVIQTINNNNEIYQKLVNEKYFKNENLKRYLNYYEQNSNLDSFNVIRNVNSNLDYNFYENYESTDISKDILMIANKHYKLEADYVPNNLVTVDPYHGYALSLRNDVYQEFIKMYEAAKLENITIFITSPYRSYNDQNYIYNSYASRDGYEKADTYSARPGFSEHQTGLAMDLTPGPFMDLDSFESSEAFLWMQQHAHEFGFILRYPKDREYITGYIYEPWHYRYVGVDAATTIKNENLTFEEYYEFYVK